MKRETVAELPEFIRRAKALLTEAERAELIDYLSANPEAGVRLAGGVRKLRFARPGGGKSGGYRVIHFYRSGAGTPLFLMSIFAKNVQENLTPQQLAELAKAADDLIASYRRKV